MKIPVLNSGGGGVCVCVGGGGEGYGNSHVYVLLPRPMLRRTYWANLHCHVTHNCNVPLPKARCNAREQNFLRDACSCAHLIDLYGVPVNVHL